ncbi:ATPase [Mycoplasmatota bacterium]|nr:ATPase [Mycoplasmatota bacterium]
MNNICKVKHVFPGGNTTQGFYSFYDYILPQEEANHIYCLKGGPGVGKSSFMKKIGKKMTDLNYFVEYHHCSSDPNSLDALVIPSLKIALIDGTSPHIVDPQNPGAVDEILNLGQFWNEEGMKQHKHDVINTNEDIKRQFDKAYQYLKAAKEVYNTYEITEKKAFDQNVYNVVKAKLISELFHNIPIKHKLGKDRHLFGYALTPIGITEFRDTLICNYETRYIIKESVGASSEELMNEIVKEAIKKGLYLECYHSPIKVEKIEDILIPELNLSISVDNKYNNFDFEYNKKINLLNLLNKDTLNDYNDEINEDKELFEVLLYKALHYINKAKSLHDKLEEYYIPNMNFKEVDKYMETVLAKILKNKK